MLEVAGYRDPKYAKLTYRPGKESSPVVKRKTPQAFNLMQTQGKHHHIKLNYIQVFIKKHELTLYTS